MSHTYKTQEICCFLADVQIILVSLFEFFDNIKVAKNAGAFLSRCSELLVLAYLVAGGRMAFGGTMMFFKGHLKKEFPRYLYLRKIWAKEGVTDENSLSFMFSMQREIFVQCLCNMGVLCMPLMIQAFGYKTGTKKVLKNLGLASC